MALSTSNINTQQVKDALGESTNSIGALCKSANINQWSKYKPVSGNWPGTKYGFSGLPSSWTYDAPTSTFRLGDFAGYEDSSLLAYPTMCAFSSRQSASGSYNPGGPLYSGYWRERIDNTNNSVLISPANLSLSGYYPCIKLTAGGTTYYKTGATALSGISGEVTITFSSLIQNWTTSPSFADLPYYIGTHTWELGISSSSQTTWATSGQGTYIPLPSGTFDNVTYTKSGSFTVNEWMKLDDEEMYFTYNQATRQYSGIWISDVSWGYISKPSWVTVTCWDGGIERTNPNQWNTDMSVGITVTTNSGAARSGDVSLGFNGQWVGGINISQQANQVVYVTITPAEMDDPPWAFSGTPSVSGTAGTSYLNYSFVPDTGWDATSVPCYLWITGSQSTMVETTARATYTTSGQATLPSAIQPGDSYLITVSNSGIIPE